MSNNDLLSEIKKLSVSERILIVESIWDSITLSDEDVPVTDEHIKELDKRLHDHKMNPSDTVKWDDLKKRIKSKL